MRWCVWLPPEPEQGVDSYRIERIRLYCIVIQYRQSIKLYGDSRSIKHATVDIQQELYRRISSQELVEDEYLRAEEKYKYKHLLSVPVYHIYLNAFKLLFLCLYFCETPENREI